VVSIRPALSGVVVLPLLFWAVHAASGGYAAAFVAVGSLTLWRGVLFLRPTA